LTAELVIDLDEAVLAAVLRGLHAPACRQLVGWEAEQGEAEESPLLCEPTSSAAATLLRMAQLSEDALFAAILASPPRAVGEACERMLGAGAAPDADLMALALRLVGAAVHPDAPAGRDPRVVLDGAAQVLATALALQHPRPLSDRTLATLAALAPQPGGGTQAAAWIEVLLGATRLAARRAPPWRWREAVRELWRAVAASATLHWVPMPLLQVVLWTLEAVLAAGDDDPQQRELITSLPDKLVRGAARYPVTDERAMGVASLAAWLAAARP
jgi:hypothetical protein